MNMHADDNEPQAVPSIASPVPSLLPDVVADISFSEAQQAEKTIRRLKRGNPVRKLARNVMNRRPIGEVQPLFESLADTSRPAGEREIAAWTLGWTPLDAEQQTHAATLLRDVLEGEQAPDPTRGQRILKRTLAVSLPVTFLFLLWILHLLWIRHLDPYGFRFSYQFSYWYRYYAQRAWPMLWQACLSITALALVPTVPVSLLLDRKCNNRVRAAAAVALGRLQSVEAIGALTTALYDRSASVRRAAVSALKNILPLLTNAHYGQLGVQVIPNLCRALQHGDELLVLHVLSALELIGDGQATRPVEQMVRSGRTERLRNLAARVLPMLQERQRQEKASQMLLRAATPVAPGADMLLRAVDSPMQEAVVPAASSFIRSADPTVSPDRNKLQYAPSPSPLDAYSHEEELPQQLQQGGT
jgi:hypothetical protein